MQVTVSGCPKQGRRVGNHKFRFRFFPFRQKLAAYAVLGFQGNPDNTVLRVHGMADRTGADRYRVATDLYYRQMLFLALTGRVRRHLSRPCE